MLQAFRLPFSLSVLILLSFFLCAISPAEAQVQFPYLTAGHNSSLVQADFNQLYMGEQLWNSIANDQQAFRASVVFGSGAVSALDLQAPDKALQQLKQAYSFLRDQDAAHAIKCLQQAIAIYPEFFSAHINLGLAYLEQKDPRAKGEFETASRLDDKFPAPFLNLGILALSANNFLDADSVLQKAAYLSPNDPHILLALAFAENGAHKYQECLRTVAHIHAIRHRGIATAHYIAAAAAMSLRDLKTVRSELHTLLDEDPANPLSPLARNNLAALTNTSPAGLTAAPQPLRITEEKLAPAIEEQPSVAAVKTVTVPNSDRLKAELRDIPTEDQHDLCLNCVPEETTPSSSSADFYSAPFPLLDLYTIHQAVDETALFFAVSEHGRSVTGLSPADVDILDDNKPPEKLLQFIPQSELPLRIGLLIDTSDSIERRFSFERIAAAHFLARTLGSSSDLAFVAGFNTEVSVTQDFTGDPAALERGIEMLSLGGRGTSVFDAIHFACWKLAAYPDQGRVARVLLVLTDGEDNSSRRSLKQSIEQAELAGVTVYTVNTADFVQTELQTDAERVLKAMAERSGGEFIYPGNIRALDHYLSKLPEVIRNRYLIAYRAADFSPNGKFRSVQVTAQKDGRHLQVHVRRGYYARLESPY